MTIKKIARVIRTAGADADIARRSAHTPEFREAVTKDRRTALSRFAAVRDALRDRQRIAAAKGGEKANRGNAKSAKSAKNSKKK